MNGTAQNIGKRIRLTNFKVRSISVVFVFYVFIFVYIIYFISALF